MKKIILLLCLIPQLTLASYSKPKLIARLMYSDAWNAPDSTWCFSGEPAIHKDEIYLNCFDEKSGLMGKWGKKGFEIVARALDEQLFSKPVNSFGKLSFYEFSEYSIQRSYLVENELQKIEIRNLGPVTEASDSFLPLTPDSFFFKTKGEVPQLWIWRNDVVTPFFNPMVAYIFSPRIGLKGEIAFKTRELHLGEDAPDKLWLYENGWKVVLEDKDSNSSSPWKSFGHLLVVEGNKILTIANDGASEKLILVTPQGTQIIATAGVDLGRFDLFSPKMGGGTILIRGEDFRGNKVTYVKDEGPFRSLISQGDIVHTDRGAARVFYHNQDAIFYGSQGIDEKGNVVLQATLTDADHPGTLLGVGIIRFNKE